MNWEQHRKQCHLICSVQHRKEQGENLSTREQSHPVEDRNISNGDIKNSEECATSLCKTREESEGNDRLKREEFEEDITDYINITVLSNKKKHKLDVSPTWSSTQIWTHITKKIHVPADELKMIHRGRKIDKEVIGECIGHRAVFQAIGVEALSEEGLDSQNVDYVMDKMKTDRNTAISALRLKGDVIDAILYLGNR